MTKSEITYLINQPEEVSRNFSADLQDLSVKYPWCQAIHLLYTKSLHQSKNLGYLDSLKYTAAITSDRKRLYQQIMQVSLLKKIEAITEQVSEKTVEKTQEQVEQRISFEKREDQIITSREEIEEIFDKKLKFIISSETLKSEEKKETLPIEETKTEEEIVAFETNTKVTDEYSELEKQILWEAVNASIQVDASTTIENLPELDDAKNSVVLDQELKKYQEEQKSIDFKSKQTFFTWLTPHPTEEISSEKKAEKEQTEDLIDKFLKADPKITPSKTEFYTPGNMAKLSITDNEDFVSETLAVIYIKQGYYPKAIRVFEKLSLKFPEKSTYFAARIKELESLQKNNKK